MLGDQSDILVTVYSIVFFHFNAGNEPSINLILRTVAELFCPLIDLSLKIQIKSFSM